MPIPYRLFETFAFEQLDQLIQLRTVRSLVRERYFASCFRDFLDRARPIPLARYFAWINMASDVRNRVCPPIDRHPAHDSPMHCLYSASRRIVRPRNGFPWNLLNDLMRLQASS